MDLWDDIILSVFLCEAGGMFVRQADSGSEMDDDTQLKFYTEHRGRRRSKGNRIHLHSHLHSHLTRQTVIKTFSYCIMHEFQNIEISNK